MKVISSDHLHTMGMVGVHETILDCVPGHFLLDDDDDVIAVWFAPSAQAWQSMTSKLLPNASALN